MSAPTIEEAIADIRQMLETLRPRYPAGRIMFLSKSDSQDLARRIAQWNFEGPEVDRFQSALIDLYLEFGAVAPQAP